MKFNLFSSLIQTITLSFVFHLGRLIYFNCSTVGYFSCSNGIYGIMVGGKKGITFDDALKNNFCKITCKKEITFKDSNYCFSLVWS